MTVTDSTIMGNSATNYGGGIYGGVTVTNSTISGNSASSGGGIYGSVTMTNSTISGNSVSQSGGGIYSFGISTVNDSTISGNLIRSTSLNPRVSNGGGIYNGSVLTVENSTISGNSAIENGGGIYNDYSSTLTLLFSTVTQNQAVNGGGVYQNDVPPSYPATRGSFNVRSTIIAANLNSDGGVNPDVSGTFSSNGYNLIGDSTGSTGFGATGDIVGTSDNPIDPRLDVLAFNGGPTQTIALLSDSPAIDAGDPIVLATDPTTERARFPSCQQW